MTISPSVARKMALLIAPGGPAFTQTSAQAFAADLRSGAEKAQTIVRELTGLDAAAEVARDVSPVVLDRPGWAYSAAQSIDAMIELSHSSVRGFNSVTVGVALAAISRFVMGQYDPYTCAIREDEQENDAQLHGDVQRRGDGELCGRKKAPGRILLNAPVIAQFCAQYDLDQRDLCTWVCVHEFTHAVQYQEAPWLKDYVLDHFVRILGEEKTGDEKIGGKKGSGAEEDDMFESDVMRELTAVMSLLEGHAEFVMNAVPVAYMPGKNRIISAMKSKRKEKNALMRALAKNLSLDKKAQQYKDGAQFVQKVHELAGQEVFNRVWASPATVPTFEELTSPEAWIARITADAGDVIMPADLVASDDAAAATSEAETSSALES